MTNLPAPHPGTVPFEGFLRGAAEALLFAGTVWLILFVCWECL